MIRIYKLFMTLNLISSLLFFSSCANLDIQMSKNKNSDSTKNEKKVNLNYIVKNDEDIAILIDGEKIKNNDIYRANNAAIIADSDFDQREIIVKLIETKLITKEAERLNLNVNSYDIKNNIDALKESYKNQESGTEFIKNIMQQLDMSEYEYWLYEEEVQYNIYMKLELQKYLALNDKDYEEYVEHLTDIADIKFVDAQLESIYYNHK